jgi:uncharacterized protein
MALAISQSAAQVIIPHDQLEPETLRALIEEFVTRHGAVHGHAEAPLEHMIGEVLKQLNSRQVVVVFDEKDETCTIMSMREAHETERQCQQSTEPTIEWDDNRFQ